VAAVGAPSWPHRARNEWRARAGADWHRGPPLHRALGIMTAAPKLFVSYSWTSEDHERWVIALATALREAGVDVMLDKWDLREGQDAHHFMEQMVANSEIKKVAMICDRKYAEKANDRSGGVGTETQIISPEIYAKQDQTKFVAVLPERDAEGKPFLPIYYKSRIYIDLSSEELFARNFEQLLRWVHDKPLYVKPPLGEKPGFLSDEPKPSLGTTVFVQRALDAIKGNKAHRSAAFSEYLERLAGGFEALRLSSGGKEFDDQVLDSIEAFTPYRNEAIELFLSVASHVPTADELRALHRFFERVFPFMHRPENVTTYREWDYDNYRFIVHELFLYLIASLLRYERFEAVGQIIRQPFYVGRASEAGDGTLSFASFRAYMKSFEYRNGRLKLRRLSLRADLLTNRAATSGLSVDQLMQADFTLYVRDCLDSIRGDGRQQWWPETLLYVRNGNRPFEIFARAQSRQYFDEVKCLFDIEDKTAFDPMFKAIREEKLRVPCWEFESFDPNALLGYERLATKP
jgi:hypothetical protein